MKDRELQDISVIKEHLKQRIQDSEKILILLDYDGTLVEFASKPEYAVLANDLKELLHAVNLRPGIDVVINTGRGHRDIETLLDKVSVDLVAEHGAMYRNNGVWTDLVPVDHSWKSIVLPHLQETTLKCKYSSIEEKVHAVCWHYRNTDEEEGRLHAENLLQILDILAASGKFRVMRGKYVLDITSGSTNKGIAAQHLLKNKQYDLVIAIGDDITDEDMFAALSEHHVSVKVGPGPSKAKYRLATVQETWEFLRYITS